jgi:hypothetical protein
MPLVEYPKEFPLSEIQNVIRIVRQGKIVEEKERFAFDAWQVQGYVQGVALGPPQAFLPEHRHEVKELKAELTKLVPDPDDPQAEQPHAWPSWLSLLIKILLRLLTEAGPTD